MVGWCGMALGEEGGVDVAHDIAVGDVVVALALLLLHHIALVVELAWLTASSR